MYYNSYFDRAHKEVFAVFAPAFMCVCVCVYMPEPVSAGVCRVTQSARRCLSLSTTDRHAGPPGGKVGLQLSVPPQPAERQACDSAVTCFHQPHTCCLTLCYAKVFDPAKVRRPGGLKHNSISQNTTTF